MWVSGTPWCGLTVKLASSFGTPGAELRQHALRLFRVTKPPMRATSVFGLRATIDAVPPPRPTESVFSKPERNMAVISTSDERPPTAIDGPVEFALPSELQQR